MNAIRKHYYSLIQASLDKGNDIETAQWDASESLYMIYETIVVDEFLGTVPWYDEA